jgi:hypothetical protein
VESTRGYKPKTIKAVLSKKFGEFLASIEDEQLRALVQKNSIITGGCIASMLLGEKVNDFDLYFTDKATAKAVADYYVKRFHPTNRAGIPAAIYVEETDDRVKIVIKSAGIASADGAEQPYEYFEHSPDEAAAGYVGEVMADPGNIQDAYEQTEEDALEVDEGAPFRPVFMSTNAITLSHRVQLVLRFFGSADTIHENYDFIHCTNFWTSRDGALVLRQPALEALLAKELRYVGSKYPVCSIIRLRKFIRRGWAINAGQILKMAMQISALDLTDPVVLEDQLTGVDSAYFVQVLGKLKEKDPSKIDTAYLVEIIDRMF